MKVPDNDMMALARRIKRFIATGDERELDGLFAGDVTIIENFFPYVFKGTDAAEMWRGAMLDHTKDLRDLTFKFGQPRDFSTTGDRAYFSLPITWTGKLHGKPFEELGGASFVLRIENGAWRVAGYAWSVIEMRFL